jgi:hypothetical protein
VRHHVKVVLVFALSLYQLAVNDCASSGVDVIAVVLDEEPLVEFLVHKTVNKLGV